MHCKLQKPSIPKCSLYAKTFKKTQTPAYDAFGPFPDETLMSSIDRVLFLFGARKLQKYFNSENSPIISERKYDYDFPKEKQMECCQETKMHHNQYSNDECSIRNTPTYSMFHKSDGCSNKSLSFRKSSLSHSHSITPRIKESSYRKDSATIGIPLHVLKRSFSLCSLACRKIKEKFTSSSPPLTMPIISPQWLWTKVESYADGCQVYEIFKNSSATSHPTKFDTSKASKIIFVILPTGIIMPFETLARH